MNIKNLQAIADLCRTIRQKNFDMRFLQLEPSPTEDGSLGSPIGHATRLETGVLPRDEDGDIDFERWSESFTGLEEGSRGWHWCFGGSWGWYDNTPLGVAKRIEWMLAGKEVPNMFSGPTHQMVAMYS